MIRSTISSVADSSSCSALAPHAVLLGLVVVLAVLLEIVVLVAVLLGLVVLLGFLSLAFF